MRRRREDILADAIEGLLKKHIGGFFAKILSRVISRFAKDLANKLFEKWIKDSPDLVVDEDDMMFI